MPSGGREAATGGPRSRLTERHALALGLAVSAGFVAAAMALAVLTVLGGGSAWASIHLALAGAATVAIGAFMPHFAITLAGTRPAAPIERLTTLGLLAVGGILAVIGVTRLGGALAMAGAVIAVAGLALVARQTLAPLRDPLARRHHVVTGTYAVALLELACGVLLGAIGVLGISAVSAAWGSLRPAHAWLTLFGGISLTIFATLVYLAPTVLGARIRAGIGLATGVGGMAGGPVATTIGFAADSRPLVIGGMALTLIGAAGQVAYVIDAYRRRGPFRSEHDWRRVAIGHLLSGPVWFGAAVAVALLEVVSGRSLVGWSIGMLAIPLVAGWMLQALVGSWTHLVPSVTPGDAVTHAAQRRTLAFGSRSRLVGWNVGIALAWAGLSFEVPVVAGLGFALLGVAVLASVVLVARALIRAPY